MSGRPLAAQRHEQILRTLAQAGGAAVMELSVHLNVSPATIRRDLRVLTEHGLLERVRGGAVRPSLRFDVREPRCPRLAAGALHEILQIAHLDAAHPGTLVIGVGAGPATEAFARRLADCAQLPRTTVLTHSLAVVKVLSRPRSRHVDVVLAGGIALRGGTVVGPDAVRCLQSIPVDVAVLGCSGWSLEHGVHATTPLDAELDRAYLAAAEFAVLLAESSAWQRTAVAPFASVQDFDLVVLDTALSDAAQLAVTRRARRLVIADR